MKSLSTKSIRFFDDSSRNNTHIAKQGTSPHGLYTKSSWEEIMKAKSRTICLYEWKCGQDSVLYDKCEDRTMRVLMKFALVNGNTVSRKNGITNGGRDFGDNNGKKGKGYLYVGTVFSHLNLEIIRIWYKLNSSFSCT